MSKDSQNVLKKRYQRGGRLLNKGWSQAEVGRELGVSATMVMR